MPRLARKNIESLYCHVIVQGINKEYIFKDNEMKESYRTLLKRSLKEINAQILAYCIMDNHVHILVYADKIEDMSKLMHKTNSSYAKLYNKKNNRVGYVYRGRYYVQPINTEIQMFHCIAYIHKNPVKANIVLQMKDYKYSSYNEFFGKKDIISEKGIKLIFGSENNYLELYKEIHKNNEIEDIAEISMDRDVNVVIQEYLKMNKIKYDELVNDEKKFKELLLQLRHSSKLSLREMSKRFKMNKDKLNKIINEWT